MDETAFRIMENYLTTDSTIENWAINFERVERCLIDPDGNVYPCGYFEHSLLAEKLTGKNLDELEGWFHVHKIDPISNCCCNERQLTAFFNIYMARGFIDEYKQLIELYDDYNLIETETATEPPSRKYLTSD